MLVTLPVHQLSAARQQVLRPPLAVGLPVPLLHKLRPSGGQAIVHARLVAGTHRAPGPLHSLLDLSAPCVLMRTICCCAEPIHPLARAQGDICRRQAAVERWVPLLGQLRPAFCQGGVTCSTVRSEQWRANWEQKEEEQQAAHSDEEHVAWRIVDSQSDDLHACVGSVLSATRGRKHTSTTLVCPSLR